MGNNHKGFSPVFIILLVLIAGVAVGSGFYVWKQNEKNSRTEVPTAKTDDSSAPAKTETQNKYLAITEWGVKFKLESGLSDAESIKDDFDSGVFYLSSKALDGTECSSSKNGVGFIIRFKEDDFNSEAKERYSMEYPDAVKLNDYYYGFGVNPAFEKCAGGSVTQEDVENIRVDLKKSLNSLQVIE